MILTDLLLTCRNDTQVHSGELDTRQCGASGMWCIGHHRYTWCRVNGWPKATKKQKMIGEGKDTVYLSQPGAFHKSNKI